MDSLDMRNQDGAGVPADGGRTPVPSNDYNGMWEAVNPDEVQIPLTAEPGKPFVGPDGQVYCIADSEPEFTGISQNLNNAVPTPSSIIQMTPIVQPIALVPYASQNQPLLQYDPNSRPPEIIETRYKRKPYPFICGLACAFAALGIALILILSLISKAQGSFSASGVDVISSFLAGIGIGSTSGGYYENVIDIFGGLGGAFSGENGSFLNGIVVIGIPLIEIILIVLFVVLIVKYFRRLVIAQSPRNFSVVAFIAVILSVCQLFLLFGLSRIFDPETGFGDFFAGKAQIGIGFGAWATLVISVLILLLPAFTNKKAFVIDNAVDNQTYYFED